MRPRVEVGQEHAWKPDPRETGIQVCHCGVRVYRGGMWQSKKGGHWKSSARQPIPPCKGEAKTQASVPLMKAFDVLLRPDAPRPTQADEPVRIAQCPTCKQAHPPETAHVCRNCEGVSPESCAAKPAPSPLEVAYAALEKAERIATAEHIRHTMQAGLAALAEVEAALQGCAAELQRLRDVHLPEYDGKIGEPDADVLRRARDVLGR